MSELHIPIPHYPPFKLRSSLIDKDPVIWVHLLEGYIRLMQLLLGDEQPKLSVKSQQQLLAFLKVFLYETSMENTQIFSLGAINPEIKKNTATLRAYVYHVVRAHSIVKLGLTGELVWRFVQVYVEHNASGVRGLVEGSYKSKFNDNKKSGSISSIGVVQKHLEQLITQAQFTDADLSALSYLLGQHTQGPKSKTYNIGGGAKTKVNKNTTKSLAFAEKFVDTKWIELLERLYAGGRSIHASVIEKVMIVSVVSLPVSKVAKLMSELGINNAASLAVLPLFSVVVISDAYKQMNSGLEERLPFLRQVKFEAANPEDVAMLQDLFPQLDESQATRMLRDHDNSMEAVTNAMLENPALAKKYHHQEVVIDEMQVSRELERARFDDVDESDIYKKEEADDLANVKQRTLEAALRLMYEEDEDEPDDTYDDQEITTGVDDTTARLGGRLRVDEAADRQAHNLELHLFSEYKAHGQGAFEKSARKSALRQDIKKSSGWSDEQLEGWMRMLLKSPRRYKQLEEMYLFSGNPNRAAKPGAKTQKEDSEKGLLENATDKPGGGSDRRAHAQAEKNKAARANHNRKQGQSRKAASQLAGMR